MVLTRWTVMMVYDNLRKTWGVASIHSPLSCKGGRLCMNSNLFQISCKLPLTRTFMCTSLNIQNMRLQRMVHRCVSCSCLYNHFEGQRKTKYYCIVLFKPCVRQGNVLNSCGVERRRLNVHFQVSTSKGYQNYNNNILQDEIIRRPLLNLVDWLQVKQIYRLNFFFKK